MSCVETYPHSICSMLRLGCSWMTAGEMWSKIIPFNSFSLWNHECANSVSDLGANCDGWGLWRKQFEWKGGSVSREPEYLEEMDSTRGWAFLSQLTVYFFLLLSVGPLKAPLFLLLGRSWKPQHTLLRSDWTATQQPLIHLNELIFQNCMALSSSQISDSSLLIRT